MSERGIEGQIHVLYIVQDWLVMVVTGGTHRGLPLPTLRPLLTSWIQPSSPHSSRQSQWFPCNQTFLCSWFLLPPINFSLSGATPPPTSCHNPIPPSIFHSVVIYFQKSCQNAPLPFFWRHLIIGAHHVSLIVKLFMFLPSLSCWTTNLLNSITLFGSSLNPSLWFAQKT